jgi:hypothetical protein
MAAAGVGHHLVIDQGNGLRLHVTKAFRPTRSKRSRMSWSYLAAAGPDIRLLLVADCIHNSGKLMLDDTAALDTQGFQAVYVFPYPEAVMIFTGERNAA